MTQTTEQKQTHRHREQTCDCWGGGQGSGSGVWGWQMQTIICRMDTQQGPTVQQGELYSTSYDKP